MRQKAQGRVIGIIDNITVGETLLADGLFFVVTRAGTKIDKKVAVGMRKHINCSSKRDEQRSCGGRWRNANLADTACRVPTTSAVYVILNEVKNLSIRVFRYFTTLRSVQHDSVRAICHFEPTVDARRG